MIQNEQALSYFYGCYAGYKKQEISKVVSENDTMLYGVLRDLGEDRHDEVVLARHMNSYQDIGKSAVREIIHACIGSFLPHIKTVLDLACGHGRVTRHLVKLFPEARISAADVNEDGVNFCAEQFGVEPIYLPNDLAQFDFGKDFDVVWCGSLFTHFPPETINRWIFHLCEYLSPSGIFVFTQHGTQIAEGAFQQMGGDMEEYRKTGYGFLQLHGDKYQIGEGLTVAHPSAVIRDMCNIKNVKIISFRQKAWVEDHDVVVLGKFPI